KWPSERHFGHLRLPYPSLHRFWFELRNRDVVFIEFVRQLTGQRLCMAANIRDVFFVPSTKVVPVPQNGSNRTDRRARPKSSEYCRTRCGGYESTNRYQSWIGWSCSWSALLVERCGAGATFSKA